VTSAVLGRPLGEATAAQVAEGYAAAVNPLEDARGSSWYRREVVRVLVRRSLLELAAGTGERP
jgi:aerobic carbon-monoxide dehydrogenase medium subunit